MLWVEGFKIGINSSMIWVMKVWVKVGSTVYNLPRSPGDFACTWGLDMVESRNDQLIIGI